MDKFARMSSDRNVHRQNIHMYMNAKIKREVDDVRKEIVELYELREESLRKELHAFYEREVAEVRNDLANFYGSKVEDMNAELASYYDSVQNMSRTLTEGFTALDKKIIDLTFKVNVFEKERIEVEALVIENKNKKIKSHPI